MEKLTKVAILIFLALIVAGGSAYANNVRVQNVALYQSPGQPAGTIDIDDTVVADSNLVHYRVTRASNLLSGEDAKKVVTFDIKSLKIPIPDVAAGRTPIQYVHFSRPGYLFRRDSYRHKPDKYGHGGLSLGECMIPMAVLGPRKKDQGLLMIESFRQVGSVSEGETLELEIGVRVAAPVAQDIAISLSFNLKEVPAPRKEIFTDAQGTYRLRWTPSLPEITAEQREAGVYTFPVTVTLAYQHGGKAYKISRSTDMRIKLDTSRLRRRLDNKLDLLMGKVPKELKS